METSDSNDGMGVEGQLPGPTRVAAILVSTVLILAVCFYLRSILIPTVMAIFLSYVLTPFVAALTRIRIPGTRLYFPRSAASLIVVMFALALVIFLGVFIVDQTTEFVGEIPKYQDSIAESMSVARNKVLAMQEYVGKYIAPNRPHAFASPDLVGEEAKLQSLLQQGSAEVWTSLSDYVFGGITSLLEFTGQLLTCLFVLFFVLYEGPVLRTKVINIVGTSLRRRRIALEIMRNVNEDVQRYLFNRVITNLILGIAVGITYYAFGLKYSFLLASLAAIFNFVPYVGPMIGVIFPALAAYLQFGDWKQVMWVLLAYTLLTGIEGNLVTPIVLGRHLKLNSLAVLLACIFWGWIWGPIGLFLAVPIMAVFKALAEHFDPMRPVGELLRG